MTLESWQWANPEFVLQRKQEAQLHKVAQCGDCIHARMIFQHDPRCTVKYQRFGFRCTFYEKADKND